MAAVIGALRVDLGLNSAEFSAGLKRAQVGLGSFAKVAGAGLLAVGAAATAAATAMGYAVKKSIDNADQMGEMAQKIGISVEALSSLGYAAKLSGTDAETLAASLRKLSVNMLGVAQGGTGPVATAFKALGVSVVDASGKMRSSDEVMLDIADRFSQLDDGSTKTALAMQLFGKSGAELVPFLSQGKEGIGALTDEADRLGVTISGSTAAAAGQFNDILDRLRATFDGVVNKVTAGVLPSLISLSNTMGSPAFAANATQIATAVVKAMEVIINAVNLAVGAFNALKGAYDWASTHDMFGNAMAPRNGAPKTMVPGFYGPPDQARAAALEALKSGDQRWTQSSAGNDFYATLGIFPPPGKVEETETALVDLSDLLRDLTTNTGGASAATDAFNAMMGEGKSIYEATRTPAETYASTVERLNELLAKGAIDQDTYNRAVLQAQDVLDQASKSGAGWMETFGDKIGNAFSSIIDGSKSAGDAIKGLIGTLAELAIQQGLKWLLGTALGGVGGTPGLSIPGFASGTNFAPGGMALVGEQGPELVNLPRGSQVFPNDALRSMGGTTIAPVINVGAGADALTVHQLRQWARFELPGLVNGINNDPLARG